MQDVKLIVVDDITLLSADDNFIVKDVLTDKKYFGNSTSIPDEILTASSPAFYANHFLLMGG